MPSGPIGEGRGGDLGRDAERGREGAPIRDEDALRIVQLPPGVYDGARWVSAHPARTLRVAGGETDGALAHTSTLDLGGPVLGSEQQGILPVGHDHSFGTRLGNAIRSRRSREPRSARGQLVQGEQRRSKRAELQKSAASHASSRKKRWKEGGRLRQSGRSSLGTCPA